MYLSGKFKSSLEDDEGEIQLILLENGGYMCIINKNKKFILTYTGYKSSLTEYAYEGVIDGEYLLIYIDTYLVYTSNISTYVIKYSIHDYRNDIDWKTKDWGYFTLQPTK